MNILTRVMNIVIRAPSQLPTLAKRVLLVPGSPQRKYKNGGGEPGIDSRDITAQRLCTNYWITIKHAYGVNVFVRVLNFRDWTLHCIDMCVHLSVCLHPYIVNVNRYEGTCIFQIWEWQLRAIARVQRWDERSSEQRSKHVWQLAYGLL